MTRRRLVIVLAFVSGVLLLGGGAALLALNQLSEHLALVDIGSNPDLIQQSRNQLSALSITASALVPAGLLAAVAALVVHLGGRARA